MIPVVQPSRPINPSTGSYRGACPPFNRIVNTNLLADAR